jgi:hypothetical protein
VREAVSATEVVLAVVAAAALLALLALWRSRKNPSPVRRTRIGFFIERDRYEEDHRE